MNLSTVAPDPSGPSGHLPSGAGEEDPWHAERSKKIVWCLVIPGHPSPWSERPAAGGSASSSLLGARHS